MGSPVSSHYAVHLKLTKSCMSIISTKLKRKRAAREMGKIQKPSKEYIVCWAVGTVDVKTKSTNLHNEIHSSCLNYYLLGFDR